MVVAELSDGGQSRAAANACPMPAMARRPEAVLAPDREPARRRSPRASTGADLQSALPPGAARNALDCAFWDFEAKATNRRAYELRGICRRRKPVITAFTISIGSPDAMAAAANAAAQRPLLKVKLGQTGDRERIAAVRAAAPEAELIVDANEGWNPDNLADNLAACAGAGVTLVEQPLPDGADDILSGISAPAPDLRRRKRA